MRIFIIGFMGSGKTHWATIWSKEYRLTFIDLDKMIEAEEQLSIEKIFEKKGEAYFRNLESEMLKNTLQQDNCIIACGGGTPCYFDNMEWMNQQGETLYLQGTPLQLYENLFPEINKRPLLKQIKLTDLEMYIETKLKERIGYYQQARHSLPMESLHKNSIEHIISFPK